MNDNTEIKNNRKKRNKLLLVIAVILSVLVVVFIVKFKGNINKKNIESENIQQEKTLIGVWTTDGVTVYEFKENGNGTLKLPLSEYKFTYKIEGNNLFINFESKETRDSSYEYFFEKENLILKGIKGTTGNYTFYKQ
ncbi:MAG: hypothetical protein IJE68_05380 [Clostridia bacterium]|nr:hypothetical protein [Clostridia bacterium]